MKFRLIFIGAFLLVVYLNSSLSFGTSIISSNGTLNKVTSVDILGSSVVTSKNFKQTVSSVNNIDDSFIISNSSSGSNLSVKIVYLMNLLYDTPIENIPPEYTVNLFSLSSDKSKLIDTLEINDFVCITKELTSWYEVSYKNSFAYIKKSDLNINAKDEEIVEDKIISVSKKEKFAKVNTAAGLNLRESTDPTSKVLATLTNGSTHKVLEDVDNEWVKVLTTSGLTGYINKAFVNIYEQAVDKDEDNNELAQKIIIFAKRFLGKPYIYGGTNLYTGTDCSGFTYSVFENFGITINRTSKDQFLNGVYIEKEDILPGDLIFFNDGGTTPISHVGIYIGNNEYIHSTETGTVSGVIISNLSNPYAERTYYGAKRVI